MDLVNETAALDLLLVAGVQGSGKTLLAQTVFSDRMRVNLDEIRFFYRQMTAGKPFTSSDWTPRLEPLFSEIEERIIRWNLCEGHRLVVDNTNVVRRTRSHYRRIARDLGKTAGVVFLDLPVEVCLLHNGSRRLVVPEAVVRAFHARREAPTPDEGFDYHRIVGLDQATTLVDAPAA